MRTFPIMSLSSYEFLSALTAILELVTLFVGLFLSAAALQRLGRPAALALLAFVLQIFGLLASAGALALVRSSAIDPAPKFLALGAGNAASCVAMVVSYGLLFMALFARREA